MRTLIRKPWLVIVSPHYATLFWAGVFFLASFLAPNPWDMVLFALTFVAVGLNRVWTFRYQIFGMSRRDRKAWAGAADLQDVGILMAAWMCSNIQSRPGYTPGEGPDPETYEIMDELVIANSMGFVTDNSQPAVEYRFSERSSCSDHPLDGNWVRQQRAAVTGFADDAMAERLRKLASDYGLEYIAHQGPLLGDDRTYAGALPVSRVICETNSSLTSVETIFGVRMPVIEVREAFSECSNEVKDLLVAAWQVTLIAPEWGLEGDYRLWDALRTLGSRAEVDSEVQA